MGEEPYIVPNLRFLYHPPAYLVPQVCTYVQYSAVQAGEILHIVPTHPRFHHMHPNGTDQDGWIAAGWVSIFPPLRLEEKNSRF